MEEAIQLVRDFAAAEQEAVQASYLERDEGVFEEKLREATRFMHRTPEAYMSLPYGHHFAAGDTSAQRELARRHAARKIFMVKHYRNEALGDLYGIYVTSSRKWPQLRYGDILYVARVGDEMKIVSRYAAATFSAREGLEWEWREGLKLPDPGELVEVRKLLAPEVPEHREHYDAS